MIAGCVLKYVLRQPWQLVFTAAAQRRLSAMTRFFIRRMDRVIATSEGAAAHLGVSATVIPHGVNTDRFHPAPDQLAAWQATGLPGDHGIGIFGRVRPQKGTDLFVDAAIALLPQRPAWTAVIIGLTTPEHAAFRDTLRERIAAAGLSERIVFKGELPTDEIPGWYRCLSLVAAPARSEGFGLTPLEAMASGTPVVASRAGAFAMTIMDGKTGILVDGDAPAPLAAAIARLMDDDALRSRMGDAARDHVTANFSIEAEARGINAVYEELWAAGRPA